MTKLGVIHYNTPGATLEETLAWASGAGFGFIELMPPDVVVDDVPPADALKQAADVRKLVNSYGMRVSAFSARNDFIKPDNISLDREIARMALVMDVTRALDDEAVVRTEGGWEKESVPREKWAVTLYHAFARCRDTAEKKQVALAIDNHGTITNEGDMLIELLKRLDCPFIGSNLDTMNFRWLGTDIATCNRYYREIAPFVKHVHLKDGTGSRDTYKGEALGDGEIDLPYAIACLRDARYSGAFAAEYEGSEVEGGVGYGKCLSWMRSHL